MWRFFKLLQQFTLFKVNKRERKKRLYNEIPTYTKTNKIKNNIKEWNTIKHIYRYQTFYKICSTLYFLTFDNQLACLDYYSETESDYEKTYTVKYAVVEETMALSIKERIQKHLALLRKIKNNDDTLEYDIKKIDSDNNSLF